MYYSSISGHDISAPWEPLNSKTLEAAKREAVKRHKDGYHHHCIVVGEDGYAHDGHGLDDIIIVAKREMVGSWLNVDV